MSNTAIALAAPPGRSDAVLEAARSGDEKAFEQLVAEHRAGLYAHCYRMLGSRHDADDALQDGLFRAWRAIPRFEGRSSVRNWLYRIVTNTCLDLIARRRKLLPADHEPHPHLADAVTDERLGLEDDYATPDASYERREAVEVAFIAALQHLPPRQRATLILRDVFGLRAKEVAGVLDATTAAVNNMLQRARSTLERRNPEGALQATARAMRENRLADIVDLFVEALERGDVGAIVALLAEDVRLAMPPNPDLDQRQED
jgi:RNA polymerase sigma-70 factor (ECF subfamily)